MVYCKEEAGSTLSNLRLHQPIHGLSLLPMEKLRKCANFSRCGGHLDPVSGEALYTQAAHKTPGFNLCSKCKTRSEKKDEVDEVVVFDPRIKASPPASSKSSKMSSAADLLKAIEDDEDEPLAKFDLEEEKKFTIKIGVLSTIAEDDELAAEFASLLLSKRIENIEITEAMVKRVKARVRSSVKATIDFIKSCQRVSICFVLDTTGSMGSYIDGVKNQINSIVRKLQASRVEVVGIAFVGYKDWCDGEDHFEILPFTDSISDFTAFISGIDPNGGGDFPEDVLGGIHQALKLSWPSDSGVRVLYHIADAPPHGYPKFHDGFSKYKKDAPNGDSYPLGHPKDLSLEDLFQLFKNFSVRYFFGKVNGECDKMLGVFQDHYSDKIESFDVKDVSALEASVVESVSISVARSCSQDGNQTVDRMRPFTLMPDEPDWSSYGVISGIQTWFRIPSTIEEITSYSPFVRSVSKLYLKIAPHPFARGSVRLAYFGQEYNKERLPKNDCVLKEMLRAPIISELERSRYLCDLEVLTVSTKLAQVFNEALRAVDTSTDHIHIQFLKGSVYEYKVKGGESRILFKENRYFQADGPMMKFTNNWNFKRDFEHIDIVEAFCHFTYHVTEHYLIVCDIQGIVCRVRDKPTLLLTDPAIHCDKHKLRFGKTNLKKDGMDMFLSSHTCNKYCRSLGLPQVDMSVTK